MNAIMVMINATRGNIVEIDDCNSTEFIIVCRRINYLYLGIYYF